MKQNKILLMLLAALLMPLAVAAQTTSVSSKCVLLLKATYTHEGTNTGLDDDEVAAADWFYTNYASVIDETGAAYKGQILSYSDFESVDINPSTTPVIWVHIDSVRTGDYNTALGYITLTETQKTKLANYVKAGGNLFLTNYATPLVEQLGRISAAYTPKLMNDGADNKKGINPEIGIYSQEYDHRYHPLFNGLTSQPREDGGKSHIYYPLVSGTNEGTGLKWDFNSGDMSLSDNPNKLMQFEVRTNSIVLGAWEHVVDYACAGLIEFLPVGDFKGRIIANGMGGYEWASAGNTYQANIETLTSNALTYLSKKKLKQVAYLLPTNIADGFDEATALANVDEDDEKTALTWFYDELVSSGEGIVLRPKDLADLDPTAVSTMWIHIDRDTEGTALPNHDGRVGDLDRVNMYELLQRYVKNGGNLLLTKFAVYMVRNGFINRAKDEPNELSYKKNDATESDTWAINAVIGGGYVIDQNTTETYKYWNYDNVATDGSNGKWADGTVGSWPTKDGKKYVSYFWRHNDSNVAQQRSTDQADDGNIWDNRSHHLYYKMVVNDGTGGQTAYPLNCVAGFGTIQYEVINIIGKGFKEDHNCLWSYQSNRDGQDENILYFQRNNKADVLGQWAHKTQLDNAAIVDFKPCFVSEIGESKTTKTSTLADTDWDKDAWEGHILCIGLGAYEWQPSNSDGTPNTSKENIYIDNIKQLTYNALNVLENDLDDAVTTPFTIDNVDYVGVQKSGTSYAMISKGATTLEKYDLVGKTNESNPKDGYVTYDNVSYPITIVGVGAFTQCTGLAYADLIDFHGIVPDDIRNRFPEHTLIYLPTSSEVTGQNIVNTDAQDASVKTCADLKVFDKKFWANKYAFTTKKMSYSRDYTTEAADAEKYKTTVALPFPIDRDHAAEFGLFYKFNGLKNGSANYKLVASTDAYQPYMFMPKASAIGFTSATDVTIPALEQDEVVATSSTEGGEFIARYRYIPFEPADNYEGSVIYAYKKGTAPNYNTFVTTSKYINVNPFRVYLKTPKAAGARMLLMTFDDSEDMPTEIDGITTQPALGAQPVYDLSGRRIQLGADLSRLTRGIYIIGGRKVVIK